ncbi:mediator complex subunit 13 C-terminal-domain-containing protein [Mycena floridula]|nr:mediator complex subunit 13 C-terminal-domain-containing protein [Mycena floridula]
MALPQSLLASAIPLPEDAAVAYRIFKPTNESTHLSLELARREIFTRNASRTLLGSLFSSTIIGTSSCIHVYSIVSSDQIPSVFDDLAFQGLIVAETSSFELGEPLEYHVEFLNAIRNRLIDDIIQANPGRPVHRLASGFVLGTSPVSNEWSLGWESSRTLLYCHLQLHITTSRILVQPLLYSTPLLRVLLPLSPGTPISLLPYATPAYYLTTYRGPTSALTKQFQEAFVGLGLGQWDNGSYIIAWIAVENKQGEEKGITVVYPSSLCLSYIPSCVGSRRPLAYIPQLPVPLQASPQIPSSTVTPDISLPSSPSGPPVLSYSAAPATLRAFRTGTASKLKDIQQVAIEVGGYVDAVARERERERERLKRERERSMMEDTPVPMPPPTPQQTFYPSPPQTNPMPVSDIVTSPVIEQPSLPETVEAIPATESVPFDTYMDATWSGMDMGDMGFPMEFSSTETPSTTNITYPSTTTVYPRSVGVKAMDFEPAFTDDDFDFFDSKPSAVSSSLIATSPLVDHFSGMTGLTPSAVPAPLGMSPPIFDVHPSPWGDSFETPDDFPAELLPSPPDTISVPVTPNVQLEDLTIRMSVFDPIPFASSHRLADGKYARGKFSLPSPPQDHTDDEDDDDYFPNLGSPMSGWRSRYASLTDPRIGVVKKLIGVKRKLSKQHGGKAKVRLRDWEEPPDREIEDMDEDEDSDDDALPSPVSRPSTPPPAYLPLGPSLLSTHFHHSHLLPLSTPLRPAGAPSTSVPISLPTPVSMPTPVSPAAISENSKSLETAAAAVSVEVVENGVWGDAWRDTAVGTRHWPSLEGVWPSDIRNVKQLLSNVKTEDFQTSLDLDSVFGQQVQRLEAPMISIGKGDAVIQVLPTALRFWEKLGLRPKGGDKDVVAFVLFEDNADNKQAQVEAWLANLVTLYKSKRYGALTRGTCTACVKDGLVPVRFESFRKSLAAFISALPAQSSSHLAIFVITPSSTLSLSSPSLRHVFSAVKKTTQTYNADSSAHILFQYVPEQAFALPSSMTWESPQEVICASLYNRIQRPVDRWRDPMRKWFEEPAYTLARSQPKVSFVRSQHASLDVLDRHTFLHVAYNISKCGKWILGACIDERGEAHDSGIWATQEENDEEEEEGMLEEHIVCKIWDFTSAFVKKADVEWRVVITRLGTLKEAELTAWKSHLASSLDQNPPLHVSIVFADSSNPWTFCPPPKSASSPQRTPSLPSQQLFVDVSATTYALFAQTSSFAISSPVGPNDLGLGNGLVPEASSSPDSSERPLLPLGSSSLVRSPSDPTASISMLWINVMYTTQTVGSSYTAETPSLLEDITKSFYSLSVLASLRWRLNVNPILPFHIGAIDAMREALEVAPE